MKKSTINIKWTIIGFCIVLAFTGLIYFLANIDSWSNSASDKKIIESKIEVIEESYDFGSISIYAGEVRHTFQLRNEGPDPIVINKIYTSCMCTTAYIIPSLGKIIGPYGMPGHVGFVKNKVEIGPGEEFAVEAVFDQAVHGLSGIGFNQRSIYLETDSVVSPKIELRFIAQVTN